MLETATGAWIGLNDRESESRYVWNFQKYLTQSYFPWGKGEPSNYNGNCNIENCVVIKSSGQWNDVICDSFNPYVCQVSSIYNGELIGFLSSPLFRYMLSRFHVCHDKAWVFFNSHFSQINGIII